MKVIKERKFYSGCYAGLETPNHRHKAKDVTGRVVMYEDGLTEYIYAPKAKVPGPVRVPSAPKARVESESKLLERLLAIKFDDAMAKRFGHVIGVQQGRDFILRASDGHRALLTAGTDGHASNFDFSALPKHWITLDQSFFLALRQAQCIDATTVLISVADHACVIQSRDDYTGDEATIEVSLPDQSAYSTGGRIGINAAYLLDGLGVWPARLYFGKPSRDLRYVITADQASWRYVVMGVKL